MTDLTLQQQREWIEKALIQNGFEKITEVAFRKDEIGVDITNITKPVICRIVSMKKVTDDPEGILAPIKQIILDAREGIINNTAEEVEYKKPAEKVTPENLPAIPEAVKSADTADLTTEMIRKYINPKATEQEAFMFLQMCKFRGLNPFLREAYLIKYGPEEATMVVGKDAFMKRAEANQNYDGFEAGIVTSSNGKMEFRAGTLLDKGEELLGGWAKVYRKDHTHPVEITVNFSEYVGTNKQGQANRTWGSKPTTMIRKVALVQALREAFPADLGGMYDQAEVGVEVEA